MNHVWLKIWCTQQYHFPHISTYKDLPCFLFFFTSFHKEGRSRTKEGVRITQTSDTTQSPPSFFNHCKYDFSVVCPWWIINYSKLIFIVCGTHLRLRKRTRRCWRVSFITRRERARTKAVNSFEDFFFFFFWMRIDLSAADSNVLNSGAQRSNFTCLCWRFQDDFKRKALNDITGHSFLTEYNF